MTRAQGYTLITGATRGIGRAIADLLAARGEPVMGIARSGDAGFPGPLLQADLLDAAQRREVLREAASHGVLRLVNNAGFNQMQPLGEITDAATSAILELNIAVAIDAAQAVLPGMTEAGAGPPAPGRWDRQCSCSAQAQAQEERQAAAGGSCMAIKQAFRIAARGAWHAPARPTLH